jgi:hypothetical protein
MAKPSIKKEKKRTSSEQRLKVNHVTQAFTPVLCK